MFEDCLFDVCDVLILIIRCKCVNYCKLGGRRSIDYRVFFYRRRIGEYLDILRRN